MAFRMRDREECPLLCPISPETMLRMEALAAVFANNPTHYAELGAVLARRLLTWLEPLMVTKYLLNLQTNA
jgi:hypothetical protein